MKALNVMFWYWVFSVMWAFMYCSSTSNFPFSSETSQTTKTAVKQAGPMVKGIIYKLTGSVCKHTQWDISLSHQSIRLINVVRKNSLHYLNCYHFVLLYYVKRINFIYWQLFFCFFFLNWHLHCRVVENYLGKKHNWKWEVFNEFQKFCSSTGEFLAF